VQADIRFVTMNVYFWGVKQTLRLHRELFVDLVAILVKWRS